MRILINAASAHMGGAVTSLQSILRWLPEKMPASRFIVYVPEATCNTLPEGEGIDVRAYPYSDTGSFQRLYFDQIEIPKVVRRTEVDLLYSATGFGTFWSPVPQVLEICNMAYFDPRYQARHRELKQSFAKKRLRRWHSLLSIRAADAVTFPTQAMREVVAKYISLDGKSTYALHYGIDRSRFVPANQSDFESPKTIQKWPEGRKPVILNVSTYAIQKNLETLIEALPHLLDQYPHLALVTTTSREQTSDKKEYDALKELAKELGVAEAWVELGYLPHDELPSVYQAADTYVFPSFTESFGHSMVEAMASGLPVVAAETEVNREVCGDAGKYFDPFDPADCAETLRSVLGDRGQQARMERASVQRADDFSWEQYAEWLARIFRRKCKSS